MSLFYPKIFVALLLLFAWLAGFDSEGAYTFLRIAVCGLALAASYRYYQSKSTILFWIFIVIAIIFNPIIEVHFDRKNWEAIDFITAVIFGVSAYIEKRQLKKYIAFIFLLITLGVVTGIGKNLAELGRTVMQRPMPEAYNTSQLIQQKYLPVGYIYIRPVGAVAKYLPATESDREDIEPKVGKGKTRESTVPLKENNRSNYKNIDMLLETIKQNPRKQLPLPVDELVRIEVYNNSPRKQSWFDRVKQSYAFQMFSPDNEIDLLNVNMESAMKNAIIIANSSREHHVIMYSYPIGINDFKDISDNEIIEMYKKACEYRGVSGDVSITTIKGKKAVVRKTSDINKKVTYYYNFIDNGRMFSISDQRNVESEKQFDKAFKAIIDNTVIDNVS